MAFREFLDFLEFMETSEVLWCVYQSACKVASYLRGAIVSVLKGLGTRVGAQGARPGEGRGRAFYAKTACNRVPGDTFLPGTHLFRALGQGGTQQFRCFGMISSGS